MSQYKIVEDTAWRERVLEKWKIWVKEQRQELGLDEKPSSSKKSDIEAGLRKKMREKYWRV